MKVYLILVSRLMNRELCIAIPLKSINFYKTRYDVKQDMAMHKDRRLPEWQNGMKAFLDMAFAKVAVTNTIQCPCRKCVNVVPKTRDEVALDLCKFGMDQAYKRWIFHGEELYDEPFDENNGDIDIRSDQERCDDASAYEMINNMIRGENLEIGRAHV